MHRRYSILPVAKSRSRRIRSIAAMIVLARHTIALNGSPVILSMRCHSSGIKLGSLQHLLGGWQLNSSFTFQSGAPFTVLNGSDPTGALNGIDSLVGNAIRPNQNTTLDTSRMTIPELLAAGGASLYSTLPAGVRVGNVGRNTLRADGIGNVDFGFIKNTRIEEGQNIQFRVRDVQR